MTIRNLAPVLLAFAFVSTGCNGGADGGYQGPKGTVSGRITVDGKAVPEKCGILFQAPATGYSATAITGPDGTYTLSYDGNSQIPAVEYQVQISGPPPEPDTSSKGPGPTPIITKPAPFHQRYKNVSTSGLTYTVKEGQNQADFDLKP